MFMQPMTNRGTLSGPQLSDAGSEDASAAPPSRFG